MPDLSLRLSTIASLVPDGARVCDVGTDHGYLAIHLKTDGKVKSIIAADINPLPLQNAAKNIEKAGVTGIELRLCDGLSGISPEETDTVVIAGMGGEVISGIIERGFSVAKQKDKILILQPTTSPEALRKFLQTNGFEILKEVPILENGKLYSVMLVKYSGNSYESPEYFYYVGKVSPNVKSGLMYIEKQQKRCLECANALKNVPEKQKDYLYYKNVLEGINDYLKDNGFGE